MYMLVVIVIGYAGYNGRTPEIATTRFYNQAVCQSVANKIVSDLKPDTEGPGGIIRVEAFCVNDPVRMEDEP